MLKLSKLGSFGLRNDDLEKHIVIREAKSSDTSMLLAIRNDPENYKWFYNNAPVTVEEHAHWLNERIWTANFFTLVAEIDGEVIGIAYLSDMESTTPKVSVSIKEGKRGIGVGTKLLQELISRSRTASIKTLFAEIKISNTASFQLFSRHGFVAIQNNSKIVTNFCHDTLEMSLNLGF